MKTISRQAESIIVLWENYFKYEIISSIICKNTAVLFNFIKNGIEKTHESFCSLSFLIKKQKVAVNRLKLFKIANERIFCILWVSLIWLKPLYLKL